MALTSVFSLIFSARVRSPLAHLQMPPPLLLSVLPVLSSPSVDSRYVASPCLDLAFILPLPPYFFDSVDRHSSHSSLSLFSEKRSVSRPLVPPPQCRTCGCISSVQRVLRSLRLPFVVLLPPPSHFCLFLLATIIFPFRRRGFVPNFL